LWSFGNEVDEDCKGDASDFFFDRVAEDVGDWRNEIVFAFLAVSRRGRAGVSKDGLTR
jgi:hypothetical protein